MGQVAQGLSTRMTLRDGMGREVRGGSGWGTHVHPLKRREFLKTKKRLTFKKKKN